MSWTNPITGGSAATAGAAITSAGSLHPPAPTAGNAHPARPGAPAAAAAPGSGPTRILPFLVGAGIALALADTRAAPIVIAILVGAIIFQLTRAADPTSGR